MDVVKQVFATGKVSALYAIPQFQDNLVPLEKAEVTWDGFKGDKHTSRTSIATIQERNANLVEKGIEILNLRQITIISKEELEEVAEELKIPEIKFNLIHPNIVVEGIKDFTQLPFGTRLQFPQNVIICLADQNYPCTITGDRIQSENNKGKNITTDFIKYALNKRGRTAFVLRPGFIKLDDEFRVY